MAIRWIRRTMPILIVCLMLLGSFAAQAKTATPVHAAAQQASSPCWENQCNDKDPINDYYCWDSSAYYFQSSNTYGWIRLWYSPTCNANWVQVHSNDGTNHAISDIFMQSQQPLYYCEYAPNSQYALNCSATVYNYNYKLGDITNPTDWYTNMINGAYKVDGQLYLNGNQSGNPLDSGWH